MNILQTSVFQSQKSNQNRITVTKQDLTSNLISQKPNNKTKNFHKKKKKKKTQAYWERESEKEEGEPDYYCSDRQREVGGERSGGRQTVRWKVNGQAKGEIYGERWKANG